MPSAVTDLTDKHALITGAARGIGAAIAERLAAKGLRLSLVGRHLDSLQALAARLPAGTASQCLVCDVGDAQAVERAWAQARAGFGPIDILINNAGQAESAPLLRTSDALWQQMLAVNLTGTFLGTRAAVPDMVKSRWGRVINIASTAGQRGYAYVSAYVAAKHGVIGLTRSLALEFAQKGITVNAVCPGYTDTDLLRASIDNVMSKTARSRDESYAEFARNNPQGRVVQPGEVADTVLWLCSPAASAINGQSVSVSGGEVM